MQKTNYLLQNFEVFLLKIIAMMFHCNGLIKTY